MRRNLNKETDKQMRLPGKHQPCCSSVNPVALLRRAHGFTLVELLTVVAVLSALALIALPAGTTYIEKARTARCLADLQTINSEIQSYYIDKNAYPDNLNKIGRDKFMDPWGQFYEYRLGATLIGGVDPRPLNRLSNDYDLWSKGPDRQTNSPAYAAESEDDLVRASDGSFFGLRSDF